MRNKDTLIEVITMGKRMLALGDMIALVLDAEGDERSIPDIWAEAESTQQELLLAGREMESEALRRKLDVLSDLTAIMLCPPLVRTSVPDMWQQTTAYMVERGLPLAP